MVIKQNQRPHLKPAVGHQGLEFCGLQGRGCSSGETGDVIRSRMSVDRRMAWTGRNSLVAQSRLLDGQLLDC